MQSTFPTTFDSPVQGDSQNPMTINPVLWAQQALGFTADPQQSEVLASSHRRVLVNCCRQWGKSTTAAVRALYHAVHNPKSETILIAPCQRQSAELLRKISGFSTQLPNVKIKSDGTNRYSLQFTNGARILALPGKRDNIRGFSKVSLLIIDEAAWVPDSLYFAVRPFLAAASNPSLLVMSTPNGDSGFFYQTWSSQQLWQRITVTAHECSRIEPAFLKEEQATLSAQFFRQEYLCEFLSHNRAVFNREIIDLFFAQSNFGPLPNIRLEP